MSDYIGLHIPRGHAKHRPDVPCGCATGVEDHIVACRYCGAIYDGFEVLAFPIWRCYDCGAGNSCTRIG